MRGRLDGNIRVRRRCVASVVAHSWEFERIAMVGDRKWEQWMAMLCKPFTQAKVWYFDVSEIDAARNWIGEGERSFPLEAALHGVRDRPTYCLRFRARLAGDGESRLS